MKVYVFYADEGGACSKDEIIECIKAGEISKQEVFDIARKLLINKGRKLDESHIALYDLDNENQLIEYIFGDNFGIRLYESDAITDNYTEIRLYDLDFFI